MEGGPEIVVCTGAVAAPLSLVWDLVSDFGRVDRWSAGPVTCTVEGHGVGAIRTVRALDRTVRERLEEWDPVEHRLSYSFVDRVPLPVAELRVTIQLAGDEVTTIRWSASGDVDDAQRAVVAGIMGTFFERRIGELQTIATGMASPGRSSAVERR